MSERCKNWTSSVNVYDINEHTPGSEEIVETAGYVNKESQIAMYTEAGIKYDNWLAENYDSGYAIEPTDEEAEVFPEMDGRRVDELEVLSRYKEYERKMKKAKKEHDEREQMVRDRRAMDAADQDATVEKVDDTSVKKEKNV